MRKYVIIFSVLIFILLFSAGVYFFTSAESVLLSQSSGADSASFLTALRPIVLPDEGPIVLDDALYLDGISNIHDYSEMFKGRNLEFAGQVYLEDGLNPGEFMIGRQVMWCCEDDTYFSGMLAWTDQFIPESDMRLRVNGIIEERDYISPSSGAIIKLPSLKVLSAAPEPKLHLYLAPGL